MTYEETLHYLYTSIPVFQNAGPSAYKPGLGTSIALDDHLGNPHKAYKTYTWQARTGKALSATYWPQFYANRGIKSGFTPPRT